MRFMIATLFLITMTGHLSAQEAAAPAKAAPATPTQDDLGTLEKASLFFGFKTAKDLAKQGLDIKQDVKMEQFVKGFQLAADGESLGMSSEELQSVFTAFEKMLKERRLQQAQANQEEGTKYMAEYAKQEGAKELVDGVMYKVLKAGDGAKPAKTDRVKIHYEGKFINGEVFDSSLKKGQPLTLGVNQFVPGFSRALEDMTVGSKWQVVIRGDKAYGKMPPPGFELDKTLVFQIELLEIVK